MPGDNLARITFENGLALIWQGSGYLSNTDYTFIPQDGYGWQSSYIYPIVHVISATPIISGCVIVTADRSSVFTGDTVSLTFQRQNTDGSIQNYTTDQLFDIQIVGSGNYADIGTLLAPDGRTSTGFTGVALPIKYIAPSTLSSGGLGIAESIQITPKIANQVDKSTVGGSSKVLLQQFKNSKMDVGLSAIKKSSINPRLIAKLNESATGASCPPCAVMVNGGYIGFSQDDSRWSGKKYDSIDKKIGQVGCALCDMASILQLLGYDVNPLTLNAWMVKNNYYTNDGGVDWKALTYYATENIISEPYIPPISGTVELHTDTKNKGKLLGTPIPETTMGSTVDTWLNNGYYVIAEVKNIHDDGSEHKHFVQLEGKYNGSYIISDPGYGDRTTLGSYNNQIYEAIIYIVYKGN